MWSNSNIVLETDLLISYRQVTHVCFTSGMASHATMHVLLDLIVIVSIVSITHASNDIRPVIGSQYNRLMFTVLQQMTLCRRDCYVSGHCKNSQWWPDYTYTLQRTVTLQIIPFTTKKWVLSWILLYPWYYFCKKALILPAVCIIHCCFCSVGQTLHHVSNTHLPCIYI